MKIITYNEILLPENLRVLESILKTSGLIVYPTDTLYGLGGNFLAPAVTAKIDGLKNRTDMPYSVAVPHVSMLESLVDSVPPFFYEWYEKLLPGKFTFLFKAAKTLDKSLLKGSDKIGIRIPGAVANERGRPRMLEIMEALDIPLVSTSVNKSGEPALNSPEDIIAAFSKEPPETAPSLLIDAGPLPPSGGSTILDITVTPVKCIRRGDEYERVKDLIN
ncbi:MAG: L-threonylcarbamoyladenylate synthase [bacterium]|nr:L-threonylcarbamoyladenylate synthase [bacterium]